MKGRTTWLWSWCAGVRLLMTVAVVTIATTGYSQTLTWLGTLPGWLLGGAYGVSADGSVVVGQAYNASGDWRAFRWDGVGRNGRPGHAWRV